MQINMIFIPQKPSKIEHGFGAAQHLALSWANLADLFGTFGPSGRSLPFRASVARWDMDSNSPLPSELVPWGLDILIQAPFRSIHGQALQDAILRACAAYEFCYRLIGQFVHNYVYPRLYYSTISYWHLLAPEMRSLAKTVSLYHIKSYQWFLCISSRIFFLALCPFQKHSEAKFLPFHARAASAQANVAVHLDLYIDIWRAKLDYNMNITSY